MLLLKTNTKTNMAFKYDLIVRIIFCRNFIKMQPMRIKFGKSMDNIYIY